MKQTIFDKIFRFVQIDINYLSLPIPVPIKIVNVFYADFLTFVNLFFLKHKNYFVAKINKNNIIYDSPYSTKTFLTACYDFFIETNRCSIFKNKPFIIDIGANIGQFLVSVKTFLPDAKVISIEPDPKIFNLLTFNSKDLKYVKLYNYALSNKKGRSDFFVSDHFSEWSSLINNIGENTKIKVETIDGDSLFKNFKSIDLIKIDVEGAEFQVLMGMKGTIKKAKYVLVEVGLSRNLDDSAPRKLIKFLVENNYSLFSIGRIFRNKIGDKQGAVDILFKNESLS